MTTYVNEFLHQNGTCTYDTDSDSVDTPLDPDVLLLVIEKYEEWKKRVIIYNFLEHHTIGYKQQMKQLLEYFKGEKKKFQHKNLKFVVSRQLGDELYQYLEDERENYERSYIFDRLEDDGLKYQVDIWLAIFHTEKRGDEREEWSSE